MFYHEKVLTEAERFLKGEIETEAKCLIKTLPAQWPKLVFNWDLNRENQRFSLDGVNTTEFNATYPTGFSLAWVNISNFDEKLSRFNRIETEDEIWRIGDQSKLAKVIAYVAKGLPITPPLVNVNSQNELCINGGNHRYTAAKFGSLVEFFPIYFEELNRENILKKITLYPEDPRSSKN